MIPLKIVAPAALEGARDITGAAISEEAFRALFGNAIKRFKMDASRPFIIQQGTASIYCNRT